MHTYISILFLLKLDSFTHAPLVLTDSTAWNTLSKHGQLDAFMAEFSSPFRQNHVNLRLPACGQPGLAWPAPTEKNDSRYKKYAVSYFVHELVCTHDY